MNHKFIRGIGAVLGLWYGFLRPVRPRWLGDLFFVMALCYGWLVLSFGVCRGDIRLGYTAAIGLGAAAFDRGPGRLFRGPFRWFWGLVGRCFRLFTNIFQKRLTLYDFGGILLTELALYRTEC